MSKKGKRSGGSGKELQITLPKKSRSGLRWKKENTGDYMAKMGEEKRPFFPEGPNRLGGSNKGS